MCEGLVSVQGGGRSEMLRNSICVLDNACPGGMLD